MTVGSPNDASPLTRKSDGCSPDQRLRSLVASLVLVLAVSACTADRPTSTDAEFGQDVYVWQRQWSANTVQAIRALPDEALGIRVLWGQFHGADPRFAIQLSPHHAVLSGRPVWPVFRIAGHRPDTPPDVLATAIRQAIRQLDDVGARLAGIEIDHDAATARLDDYSAWLKALRRQLPGHVALSITALPDWSRSAALPRLAASVDAITVQVHAPAGLDAPLFDAGAARATLAAFSRVAGAAAVRVSLPAYRIGVGTDDDGGSPALEFETPSGQRRERRYELAVTPDEVGAFARAVRGGEFPGIGGIVWFRLPQASDRHTFSTNTFHALLLGQPTTSSIRLELIPASQSPGTFDVRLRNDGPHDGVAGAAIAWPSDCTIGDALPGWRVDAARFSPDSRHGLLIRSGEIHRVGWLRCPMRPAVPFVVGND